MAFAPQTLEVVPRYLATRIDLTADSGIQQVFRHVASDAARTATIAAEIASEFAQGHKVLVLTERTEHLEALDAKLTDRLQPLVRMWERRRRGYQAMGYRIPVAPVSDNMNFGEAAAGRARSGLDVLAAPVAMAGRGR